MKMTRKGKEFAKILTNICKFINIGLMKYNKFD